MDPKDLLSYVYKYLSKQKPFNRKLFQGDEYNPALDRMYFHKTLDIKDIINSLNECFEEDKDTDTKRIYCIKSNIGDGKSALLGSLNHHYLAPCISIHVGTLDESIDDHLSVVNELILFLLYEMKVQGLIEEAIYNQAEVELLKNDSSLKTIKKHLKPAIPQLKNRYLIWLCDNVCKIDCIKAFKAITELRDTAPPKKYFFSDIPFIIIFTTSEREIEIQWKKENNPIFDNHKFSYIHVSHEDMYAIIKKILFASQTEFMKNLKIINDDAEIWEDMSCILESRLNINEINELDSILKQELDKNQIYPFIKEDLEEFLKHKAKAVKVRVDRHNYEEEVVEIQLRNTLNLLQKVIDEKAIKDPAKLISAVDLLSMDNRF